MVITSRADQAKFAFHDATKTTVQGVKEAGKEFFVSTPHAEYVGGMRSRLAQANKAFEQAPKVLTNRTIQKRVAGSEAKREAKIWLPRGSGMSHQDLAQQRKLGAAQYEQALHDRRIKTVRNFLQDSGAHHMVSAARNAESFAAGASNVASAADLATYIPEPEVAAAAATVGLVAKATDAALQGVSAMSWAGASLLSASQARRVTNTDEKAFHEHMTEHSLVKQNRRIAGTFKAIAGVESEHLDALDPFLMAAAEAVGSRASDEDKQSTRQAAAESAMAFSDAKDNRAITGIQGLMRGAATRRDIASKHAAATKIQAAARGRGARRELEAQEAAAAKIQGLARGASTRREIAGQNAAATIIQRKLRHNKLEKNISALRGEAARVGREGVSRADMELSQLTQEIGGKTIGATVNEFVSGNASAATKVQKAGVAAGQAKSVSDKHAGQREMLKAANHWLQRPNRGSSKATVQRAETMRKITDHLNRRYLGDSSDLKKHS